MVHTPLVLHQTARPPHAPLSLHSWTRRGDAPSPQLIAGRPQFSCILEVKHNDKNINNTHCERQHNLLEVLVPHNPFLYGSDCIFGSVIREFSTVTGMYPLLFLILTGNTHTHAHIPFLWAVDHVADLHVEGPVFWYQAGTSRTLFKKINGWIYTMLNTVNCVVMNSLLFQLAVWLLIG